MRAAPEWQGVAPAESPPRARHPRRIPSDHHPQPGRGRRNPLAVGDVRGQRLVVRNCASPVVGSQKERTNRAANFERFPLATTRSVGKPVSRISVWRVMSAPGKPQRCREFSPASGRIAQPPTAIRIRAKAMMARRPQAGADRLLEIQPQRLAATCPMAAR